MQFCVCTITDWRFNFQFNILHKLLSTAKIILLNSQNDLFGKYPNHSLNLKKHIDISISYSNLNFIYLPGIQITYGQQLSTIALKMELIVRFYLQICIYEDKKLLCPIYRAIEYAQIIIGRVLCLYPIDRSTVFPTLLDQS